MPDVTATPVWAAEGIPVELRNVESELARLWGPAALEAGGAEPESPNVTRIALANLVLECADATAESLAPVLATVVERFPCRAIVVCGSNDPARKVTAEISALCHLPAPGQPQVCSERIILRAGPHAVDLVPGAVRSLLEADLPHVLWWTSDPRNHPALFRELAQVCSRLILDLPDPFPDAAALRFGLDPALGICVRDSVWFGLPRWRELVAQFFDGPDQLQKLGSIESVVIEAVAPNPAQPTRLAIWLVAWLAGQLSWQPAGRAGLQPDADGSSTLTARFKVRGDGVSVNAITRAVPRGCPAAPQVAAVTIKTRPGAGKEPSTETYRLVRPWPGSPAVLVETETASSSRLPRGIECA